MTKLAKDEAEWLRAATELVVEEEVLSATLTRLGPDRGDAAALVEAVEEQFSRLEELARALSEAERRCAGLSDLLDAIFRRLERFFRETCPLVTKVSEALYLEGLHDCCREARRSVELRRAPREPIERPQLPTRSSIGSDLEEERERAAARDWLRQGLSREPTAVMKMLRARAVDSRPEELRAQCGALVERTRDLLSQRGYEEALLAALAAAPDALNRLEERTSELAAETSQLERTAWRVFSQCEFDARRLRDRCPEVAGRMSSLCESLTRLEERGGRILRSSVRPSSVRITHIPIDAGEEPRSVFVELARGKDDDSARDLELALRVRDLLEQKQSGT